MDLKAKKQSRYCAACKKAKITMANKSVRLQNQTNFQRIVLRLGPNSKKMVALLSRKLKISRRQNVRIAGQLYFLKEQFKQTQEKLILMNSTSLEAEFAKHNIAKNEQTVISEILKAAKCKDTKGRRYKEDWIILSLLFHMRSPAACRLIRDTKVLPLPCISTIRR